MSYRIVAPFTIILALQMLGCEITPKERLQGRWVGERVESFRPPQATRAAGWVTGTSFEFQGSRVTVTIPAEGPRKGTYKITSIDDDELSISFLRPEGARDEAAFQFEGDTHLRWKLGDGRSVLLRKASN